MAEEMVTDILSVAILVVLLISNLLNGEGRTKVERCFSVVILTTLGYLLVNSLSTLSEGRPSLSGLATVSNLLTFVFSDCVLIAFCIYLTALLESLQAKKRKIVLIPICTSLFSIVLTLIFFITGNLFYIDAQGLYQEGSLSYISYCISGITLLELVWVVLRNRKYFTTRQLVVILIYLCLPLVPVILEMYLSLYSLTSASMTLSVLLIYVLVQASIIERSKMRESILDEISCTDLLTGLGNRRSYYRRLSALEAVQLVGVVYCDINRLKYTNDHFGHAAGDELIQKFAKLLNDCFHSDDIYRISGDEFVILVTDIEKDAFEARIVEVRAQIDEDDHIAAMGHSFGIGQRIDNLISESEQFMYEDKRQYHASVENG